MPDEQPDASVYKELVQLISSFPSAQYIRALTLLGVPDHLLDGPRPVAALATSIGAHERTLGRYLRSCAVLGLTTEDEPDVFGLTPMGALLATGGMFAAIARATAGMHHYLPYSRTAECVRTGRPMGEETLGTSFQRHLQERPDELLAFYQLDSMASGDCGGSLAKAFDFGRYGTIVDAAGRHGDTLAQVLAAAPGARGVLFDLPAIMPAARANLTEHGVIDRVRLAGGDVGEEVPPGGGDLYLLRTVLWENDDDRAVRILRNVAAAMPDSARLLVVETFLPELPNGIGGPDVDEETRELHRVNFSVFLQRGGRVRTEEENRRLLERAGFTVERVAHVAGDARGWDLIEAHGRRP
ncbi:methyltransferase [Streptomyces sp. NPDC050560]|uniref:methyltransferase n=1 Tax=Streptomyces sp. NPDC050560 TaxID=3365630 RepID=UPI0037B33110